MDVLLDARATRQVAEVQEAIAILHIVENYHRDLPENPMPGRGRLVELAAEERLNEFVPLELAAALGVSQQSMTLLIADLLDLEYRHPLLWRQVREGVTPLWHARRIAARVTSVELGLEAAHELAPPAHPATSRPHAGPVAEAPGKADCGCRPARYGGTRRGRAAQAVEVRIQPTADGVSWLDGKLNSADGRQLDGALNRFAAILGANGDTDDREARRSSAIGILSNPALALPGPPRRTTPRRRESDTGQARETPDAGPEGGATPSVLMPLRFPARMGVRRTADPSSAGPTSASHPPASCWPNSPPSTPASCRSPPVRPRQRPGRTAAGSRRRRHRARPGGGAARPAQGHRVLYSLFDPGSVTPVDSYEIPAPMRRAVLLRNPTDVFPFGSRPSRGLDLDHTDPYLHDRRTRSRTTSPAT